MDGIWTLKWVIYQKEGFFQGCGYSVWKWSGIEKNTHIHGNEAMKRFLCIDTYKVSEYTGMVSGWKKAWGFKLLEKDFLFSALFRTSVLFPVCDLEFPWKIKIEEFHMLSNCCQFAVNNNNRSPV